VKRKKREINGEKVSKTKNPNPKIKAKISVGRDEGRGLNSYLSRRITAKGEHQFVFPLNLRSVASLGLRS
jgi:hypothetical protein